MRIRQATENDIPLLRGLARRIWHAIYPGIITGKQIDFMLGRMYSEEEIRRQLMAGVPWEIAMDAEAAIGFLSWQSEPDWRVKLNKIYLLPEQHGRGFGRKMIEHVCASARAVGARTICLQVNKSNARALAVYLKSGFQIEREAIFEIGGGFVMDDYVLTREIADSSSQSHGDISAA